MTCPTHSRRFGSAAPLFDPLAGTVVREPLSAGGGWWAGAPGAFYDDATGRFYLTYRLRGPRPMRGAVSRIAVSDDGIHYRDLLELRREQLGSDSIERCAILRGLDGRWRWFISYVDPATSQWRTDLVMGDSPEQLDVEQRQPVWTCADLPGIEGVKDPYICLIGRLYYLISSIGLTVDVAAEQSGDKHATGDIFNTGLTISSTGLSVSSDGVSFRWLGVTDAPRGAWDPYCLRVNSLLWTPPVFTAFYDGSASVAENYEERCGLAQSFDLRAYERVSTDGPILTVPHGSGSVRYVDVITVGERLYYYYEMTRPDGAHELRVSVVDQR
ncbi:MAG: hypothetical protein HZB16_20855 [Armatimonadetes bacterium]|nr:hypothetical protein [Armatimonadota bacterium]